MTYVALEGADGCGKTVQARLLAAWVQGLGHQVVHLREPGSTPVGEALRAVLLANQGPLAPITEALLFNAARSELVQQVVQPALARGAVVVAERCYLSTLVYQGEAAPEAGIDRAWLRATCEQALRGCLPDRIFVLDAAPEVARARRAGRSADRFEARGPEFQARVRAGFLALARTDPRCEVVDVNGTVESVHQALRARTLPLLGAKQ